MKIREILTRLTAVVMLLCLCLSTMGADSQHVLTSPNGKLKVTVVSGADGLHWAIAYNDEQVLQPSRIDIC